MKNQPLQVVALLLTLPFFLPIPQVIALGQEAGATTAQEKPKTESEEAKKLRKNEENQKKKEDERKRQEAKIRTVEARKYQTLSEFASDLYASDHLYREQVDEGYINLQSWHAAEAYRINISRRKELLLTENAGEVLNLRRALYDNPRIQEYVNRLGQQIVPDDSEKLYSFKVIVSPIPYAYTLSTGTVLVSTGMISVLDNEAQLAYLLAHELAHVYKDHWRMKVMLPLAEAEYNRRQEIKRAFWSAVLSLSAAGVGQAVAGDSGARSGFQVGQLISSHYASNIALDWNSIQENEADDFALKAILGKSFDIKEVPRLFATMAQVAHTDNRTQLGFLGARSRIKERTEYAQKLIDGSLQAQYQDALKANKIKGTGPDFNLIMAELKRDNGIEAFYHDMFQLAKMNLQQSVMLRSDDPLAAYYYGRVLKQVGRTKEELDIAEQSLLKAVALDLRYEIPDVQLHRALLLMDSKDNANQAEAIAAFKNYITTYGRKRATLVSTNGLLPPNVDVLYGYMRLLGEKTWTAPNPVETLKAASVNSGGSTAPPPKSVPQIEPASQKIIPVNTRKPQKP